MKFPKFIVSGFMLLVILSSATTPVLKSGRLYITNYENVLGTSFEMKIVATTVGGAKRAEVKAMAEIARLNKILSGYDKSSEFSRWQYDEKKATKVSSELYEVLSLFDKWRNQSNGALDASSEVVSRVWRDAAKRNIAPSATALANAVKTVKQPHWQLNEVNNTALHLDDAPLMLNSFVKSYIMNKACNIAIASGEISAIVMNIGGDIVVKGTHQEQILVADPKADAENDAPVARLLVNNKAVATSGNYRRGELINGQWHSHIVDPRNGQPADNVISATVVSDDATNAGALATIFNILSPDESKALAAKIPHTEFMLITSNGKHIESNGWKALELKPIVTAVKPNNILSADKTWDPNYELLIGLELNQIEGIRVHRPYIAVWIVDKDKKPIRSLALWYNKTKYLNELDSWYDAYYNKFSDADQSVSSTTSATRPAGKYTIKWNGRNDKGDLVKLGAYSIKIEAAREHGTHQLMTQELDFTKTQKLINLTGNVEIAGVSINYVKKAD
jgi:thiamine biosynthesis lipoprotein